jgi:hypothetical protein
MADYDYYTRKIQELTNKEITVYKNGVNDYDIIVTKNHRQYIHLAKCTKKELYKILHALL